MDPLLEPHFSKAALITIDTQLDTLDGVPLEIPGTSAAVPNKTELCRALREARRRSSTSCGYAVPMAATPSHTDGLSCAAPRLRYAQALGASLQAA